MWTERLRPLILERAGDLLRGDDRDRVRRLRRARRRDRRRRGRTRRAARQHQRGAAAGERGDQDRARPHEVPGRHAGEDRRREGGDRQAGCAVRRSASASPSWWTCCAAQPIGPWRALDARRGADVRVLPPEYEWTGPLAPGRPAPAPERRRWRMAILHGAAAALAARCGGDRTRASRSAWIPGRLDRRGKWLFDVAHNPDGIRALVARARGARGLRGRSTRLVSILGDKDWPEMLVQLDRAIDRGRADRGAHRREPGLGRRVAPALAERCLAAAAPGPSWTLVPGLPAALQERPARSRDGAGDRLVPHRGRRDGRAGTVSRRPSGQRWLRQLSRLSCCPCNPRPCRDFATSIPPISRSGTHIFGTWRQVAARYGFEEYDGPPLEPLELYTAKSGEEIVGPALQLHRQGRPRGRAAAGDDADARPHGGGARERTQEADPLVLHPAAVPLRAAAARPAARALPAQLRPDRRDRAVSPTPRSSRWRSTCMRAFGLGPRTSGSGSPTAGCSTALLDGLRRAREQVPAGVPGARQARPRRTHARHRVERLASRRRGRSRRSTGSRARASRDLGGARALRSGLARASRQGEPLRQYAATRSTRWASATSSISISRSCAASRTTPAPCSSCSTRQGRAARDLRRRPLRQPARSRSAGWTSRRSASAWATWCWASCSASAGLPPAAAPSIDVFIVAVTRGGPAGRARAGARAARRGAPGRVRARRRRRSASSSSSPMRASAALRDRDRPDDRARGEVMVKDLRGTAAQSGA